ncbi:MAG: hypothetical protein QM758_18430 [Armatimonas sp.]
MKRIDFLMCFSVLGLLTLSGCGSSNQPPAGKNLRAYYPEFHVGDRWRWRVKRPGEAERTEIQTVAATEIWDGFTSYRIERAPDGGRRTEADVLGLTTGRLLQFGFDTYDATGGLLDSVRYPAPWGISIDLEPGETSTQTFQLVDDINGTPVVSTFQIEVYYAGAEIVSVPAGTFPAARMNVTTTVTVRVGEEAQPPEVSHYTEWRAEGVGAVKSHDEDGTTEELAEAQVGGA